MAFIKILTKEDASAFQQSLEHRARLLLGSRKPSWDYSASGAIERELALTLEQIDELSRVHAEIKRRFSELECSIGTDILQLEPRPLEYVDLHVSERNALKARLFAIEGERARIVLGEAEKRQVIHAKLLSLMEKLIVLRV